MTSRDRRNIHTTGNSCRDALPCVNMALKLPRYFYLLMEKPLGHYFQLWSPYYQEWKTAKKMKVGVVLRQNLGQISLNVVKKVKKLALSLGFFHILLGEYLLKEKLAVVKPPEWFYNH